MHATLLRSPRALVAFLVAIPSRRDGAAVANASVRPPAAAFPPPHAPRGRGAQVGFAVPRLLRDGAYLCIATRRYRWFGQQPLDTNFAKRLCPYYYFRKEADSSDDDGDGDGDKQPNKVGGGAAAPKQTAAPAPHQAAAAAAETAKTK